MVQVSDKWWSTWLTTLGYEVNRYTKPIIEYVEENNPRFTLIYGGERGGKSFNSVAILGKKLPPNSYKEQREYWIIGPDYLSPRAEFMLLFDAYSKLNLVEKDNRPESPTSQWSMQLTTNERWVTKTSSDIAKLATFSIHGAMIVEANRHAPAVWFKVRGRIAENRGWCIINGTYEDSSEWFIDLYEKWSANNIEGGKSFSLPSWANHKAFPGGEDDPEIISLRASTTEEWFLERYAGIPQKPSNLVIPEFEYDKHVNLYKVDPVLPVELAIDPAKHTYAVAFVQKLGRGAVVLDCVYKHGWIAQKIIPLCLQNPLWPYVKMNTGYAGAIDVAGFAEPGTVSQAELWRTIGGIELYAKRYPELETRNAVRNALADNLLHFNNLGNESFNGLARQPLAEFRLWRKRTIEDSGTIGEPFDKNNDFIKALGYWWLYRFGQTEKKPRGKQRRVRGYDFTVGRDQGLNNGVGGRETSVQKARRNFRSRLAYGSLE